MVISQTVWWVTPKRRAKDVRVSPAARAARIAGMASSVSFALWCLDPGLALGRTVARVGGWACRQPWPRRILPTVPSLTPYRRAIFAIDSPEA